MPLLFVLATAAFVSAFAIRIIDPLVPSLARDFGVSIGSAAALASAYTFPYAISQPFLGVIGDHTGKERTIKVCTGILAVALTAAVIAPNYATLFMARVIAGIGGGGMIPVAFAIIGDRFPVAERQVALARLVMASQIAFMLSTTLSGLIAARLDWRVVFALAATIAAASFVMLARTLAAPPRSRPAPLALSSIKAQYAAVLQSPLARYILPVAAIEGITLFGLLPFEAHRLEARHMGGLEEAGLVIAGMSSGGVLFTLLVGRLLSRFGRTNLIRTGGLIVFSAMLVLVNCHSWQAEAFGFAILGFGFFMLHNSLQLLATELSPQSRASSVALFAFCFFLGQASGPIIYHAGFDALGLNAPLIVAGACLMCAALGLGSVLERNAAR